METLLLDLRQAIDRYEAILELPLDPHRNLKPKEGAYVRLRYYHRTLIRLSKKYQSEHMKEVISNCSRHAEIELREALLKIDEERIAKIKERTAKHNFGRNN